MEREKNNTAPHIGIIKFNIFIHKLLPDGSVDPILADCSSDFKDCKITNAGELHVTGYDKLNCINKIKERLESLNG
jgi:hypothetical protein